MKPYGLQKRKAPVWSFRMNLKGKKAERQAGKRIILNEIEQAIVQWDYTGYFEFD